jgi:hypothetical protein
LIEGLALIKILGVPDDGTPVQIRTGFMSYEKSFKLLFFAQRKRDLPHFAKILKQTDKSVIPPIT